MNAAITQRIVRFAVHQPGDKPKLQAANLDRKLTLKPVSGVIRALRWPHRPETPMGTESWTSPWIRAPQGKFSVTVSYYANGICHPFECWVNGVEAPRGLSTLAKLLSMDMRVKDPRWLQKKLHSLKGTGGDPIVITHPRDGREITVGSPVAAMATFIEHACARVGYFEAESDTDMRAALMCDSEPKTSMDGAIFPGFDICNPNASDDFVMFVKEANVDDRVVPFSIWFSGNYPKSWDGFCKVLSLDMQVADPEWIGAKLLSIVDHPETGTEWHAEDPNHDDGKGALMPSTLAYVARLLLRRYRKLGILDVDAKPVVPIAMFERMAKAPLAPAMATSTAATCPTCHSVGTWIRMDGCFTCIACAASKCQ
jgi:ribonucleoside-diphosphate reductase alpha chain